MGPVEMTMVGALVVTSLTSLVVPWWLRRRPGSPEAIDETGLRSWQSMTHLLQEERDDLKRQATAAENHHQLQLRALRADFNKKLTVARNRISELEVEVADLHARLGGGDGTTSRR